VIPSGRSVARHQIRRQRSFPARPEALADVRRFIRESAAASNVQDDVEDLLLAVSEAAANAVRHSGADRFRVRWRRSGNAVTVDVEDDGVFVEHVAVHELDGSGHRGLQIMAAMIDGVALDKGIAGVRGTRVRLVKRLDPLVGSRGAASAAAL
jgi:anti-sigma regulatory factor (Ser/Thr protein kinase)